MITRSLLIPLFRSLPKTSCPYYVVLKNTACFCKRQEYFANVFTSFNRLFTSRRRVINTSDKQTDDPDKARLISGLNFRCDEDARPFMKLSVRTLLHIYKVTKNDEKNGHCKNRLYYLSERIKCDPLVLSNLLAQRTFIYSLSFDWLEKSLNVILDMGIPSERILRDLWVLKYHHSTIRKRLQHIQDLGIDKLYPWMVRCSEDILKRFLSITKETKDILGNTNSTHSYLASRLNTTPEVVQEMCAKIPALQTIRVTKVKAFLDFLEKEGFQTEDIANKPRILTASQKTVQHRLDQLRKIGLSEINLNALCRSRKDFKKYYESMESVVKNSNTSK